MKSNSQVWHLNPAGFGVEDLLSNEQKKWKRMENQVEKSGECSHDGLLENRGQKKRRVVVNARWVWCGEGNEQLVSEERGEVERERARGVRTSEREPGLCRRVRKEVRCDAV